VDVQAVFGLQFLSSLLVWSVLAALLVSPWLSEKPKHEALLWLSLPHDFRPIGMV